MFNRLETIWEVEIRVVMPEEDGSFEEEYLNLFFYNHPTRADVLKHVQKVIDQTVSDSWTNKLYTKAKEVIENLVTEWFEVGIGGGRPSHRKGDVNFLGYISVMDHVLIKNV